MTDSVTGAVKVDYCSTPTQHNVELAHLPLPPDVKHNIAAKLHDGVRIESILDSIRDSVLIVLLVKGNYFQDKIS